MINRREFLALAAAAPLLSQDPERPRFHFLPPANWMNDPNGPIWWKGSYHLFYQYNPGGAYWGDMHWGHAVSEDLVHWRHLPVALAPTPGGPDKDGVFTGCAVDHGGTPTLVYTGVKPEVQCLATGDAALLHWTKYPRNPVIAGPPPGLDVAGFRDPCVWRERGAWWMAVGTGFRGRGGAALLYRSDDLAHWTYLHPLFEGRARGTGKDPVATGEMWECPDFFELGSGHAFFVSTERTTRYWTGGYRGGKFAPAAEGVLDYGAYYAPKSFLAPHDRRVLWGWITERRPAAAQRAAGWSGVMSLPRVLTLRSDGALGIAPAPELEKLRSRHWSFSASPARIPAGDCLELHAIVEPARRGQSGLTLGERCRITFDPAARRLSVSGAGDGAFALSSGELLDFRIYLDASVIEVYAGGRACWTARVYGKPPSALAAAAFGGAGLVLLDAWEMRPISPDRLTSAANQLQ